MSLPAIALSFAAAVVAATEPVRAQCAVQRIASQVYGASCVPPSIFYVNALVVHSQPISQVTWAEPALFGLQVTLQ